MGGPTFPIAPFVLNNREEMTAFTRGASRIGCISHNDCLKYKLHGKISKMIPVVKLKNRDEWTFDSGDDENDEGLFLTILRCFNEEHGALN